MEDGVGHGGRDSDQPDLAYSLRPDSCGPIGFADEDDVELRYIGVHGDEIVAEGCVRDSARACIGDGFFEQRHADASDGPTDDLTGRRLLVQDPAAVYHRHDTLDADEAEVGVDANFHEF